MKGKSIHKKKRMRKEVRAIIIVIIVIAALLILFQEREAIEHAAYPQEYKDIVSQASEKYNLDEALIFAVIRTESSFNPDAVSSANAMGLMQITKDTFFFVNDKDARGDLSVELLFEPEVNIDTGAYFLSWLINDFGNLDTAIAAYNAGRGNVKKWLSDEQYSNDGITLHDIPFKETKNYVRKVKSAYEIYKTLYYS